MKRIRKLLALLLALCLALSVAGCTQPEESDDDDRDDHRKNDPTDEPTPEPKQTYYLVTRDVSDISARPGDDLLIYITEFDENGKLTRYLRDDREFSFIYGEDGMLQQAIAANADGWMKTIDYTWDENGNLAEVVYKYEDGDERYRYQYEYTADGRVSKETFYDFGELDCWYIYTYTDTGYHYDRYNSDGTLDIWNDTVLDEQGRSVESHSYDAEDGSCFYFHTIEYTLNESGDLLIETTEDSYGGGRAEWVLDEHGNVMKGTVYDEDGDWYSDYSYEYAAVEMTEAQYRAYQQIVETFGHY